MRSLRVLFPFLALFGASALAACAKQKPAPSPGEAHAVPAGDAQAGAEGGAAAEPASTLPPAPSGTRIDVTMASVGLDAAALDRSADPCEDFYQFACGGWEAATEIPADRSSWSRFHEIMERNELILKEILEAAAKADPKAEPTRARLGAYYAQCMDEKAIAAAGAKPLAPLMGKIAKAKTPADVLALVTEFHGSGIGSLWGVGADQDAKDTTRIVAQLGQGGLGLPSRDYYEKDDEASKTLRATYLAHVEKMLILAGTPAKAAKQGAADVLEVETAIAKLSLRPVDMRDPERIYNKLTLAQLTAFAPGLDWKGYFTALGVTAQDATEVILHDKAYFKGVLDLVTQLPVGKWQAYLRWNLVDAAAGLLSKPFEDQNFVMAQALSGAKELPPRWKRCAAAAAGAFGEDLGREFVKLKFSGDAKPEAERMVSAIKDAFGKGLPALAWMDQATRDAALAKLGTLVFHIGYPDKWKQYDVTLDRKSYFGSTIAAQKFAMRWQFSRIGKPVDRGEWLMPPQVVNAYYNPTKNEMVFPAGILQAPFFGADRALAVNLGGIGMVIGHELTHGYDDEGSQFGADGNLKSWWTPSVRAEFEKRTQCLVDQYASYEALPGLPLNGKLTLGENIADVGGVKIAFAAYRTIRSGAKETRVADGFTEDQQFFLSVGQIWCSKRRDEIAKQYVAVDPHSPPKFRVNGSLTNTPEFHEAFSCKPGQKMRPAADKMCRVW